MSSTKTVTYKGFTIEIDLRMVGTMDFYDWVVKRDDGSIIAEGEASESSEYNAITEAQEATDDFLNN